MGRDKIVKESSRRSTNVERMLHMIGQTLDEVGTRVVKFVFDSFSGPPLVSGKAMRRYYEEAYWDSRRKLEQARQTLYHLRRQKLITIRKQGQQLFVALTDAGHLRFLQVQMRRAPRCAANECVMVIFDIPEEERRVRSQLRRFLKANEFVQLQRSVWICRKDVLKHLRAFIRAHDVGRWVHVFTGRDVPAHSL